MKTNTPQKRMRSVEAGRAVWQSKVKLTTTERLVLRALADHADQNFECYPSQDRLATMTKISKRQVIRVIARLRDKRQIEVAENAGGRSKCNHYRLLVAENGDNGNGDSGNADTRNGDILSTKTVASQHGNGDILSGNGDIAMSPEWFKGLEGKNLNGGSSDDSFPNYEIVWDEINDVDPEQPLQQITAGPTVQCNETCDVHGSFVRTGFRWRAWVALAGKEEMYSRGWSHDAGCPGCLADYRDVVDNHPNAWCIPLRRFELKTPASCPDHGNFVFEATLYEYTQEYAEGIHHPRVEIVREFNLLCPHCDADWLYETGVQHQLDLTAEEWERGKKHILKALDIARGEVQGAS